VEYLTEQLNRARSLYAEAQKVTQAVSESYYKRLYGPPETPSPQYEFEQEQLGPNAPAPYGRRLTPVEEVELGYRQPRDPFAETASLALKGLTAEVPGARRAQEVAADVGEVVGREILPRVPALTGPAGQALGEAIRRTPIADVTAKAGRVLAEAIVPTQVWDTALTLLPAAKAKTPLQAASAIILGDTDAIAALRRAGKQLGESPKVEQALARLAREAGGPGETPEELIRATQENRALREFLDAHPGHGGEVPARQPYLPTRDEEFAAALNAGKLDDDTESALIAGMEPVQEAIETGRRLGYRNEDIAAYLRRNYPLVEEGSAPAFTGEAGAKAGEAAVTSPAPKLPPSPKLDTLSKAEQARLSLSTNTSDILKIAERYERDSPQRTQLLDLVSQQTEHLPPSTQKFIRASIEVLPTKAERKAATAAQRIRQGSGADIAFRGEGTTEEKAVAAFKAMGGKQPQRFTPIGDKFTDTQTRELFQQIEGWNAAGKALSHFDAPNATSALTLLMTGQRLPGVASEATKPLNLMASEIKLLGKVFGPEFQAAIPRSSEHMRGFLRTFVDVLNLPRALVTAIDISAAGRQGIILAGRNPVEVWKSMGPMFRSMASDEGFARAAKNIRENPKFEESLARGLDLTNIGGGVEGEEMFISRFAANIPGVRASERGFVMYLDTLRMLTYEKNAARVDRLVAQKGWTVERADLIKTELARFLNHASGRGSLPQEVQEFVPALNAGFFAPKFLVSRPQSIWDMVRPGATSTSRQIAAENLGVFVAMGVGALEAARLMGADVELDPRSSDFGKIRVGNVRVDFWGGFQPMARYIAQIGTGHRKELFTGDIKYVYPGDSAMRLFRSKLSPFGATLYDYGLGKGKGYTGEDLLLSPKDMGFNKKTGEFAWNVFGKKLMPLMIQDAIEGYQASGVAGAAAAAGISAVGGGVTSFEPSETQREDITKSGLEQKLQEAGFPSVEAGWQSSYWQRQLGDADLSVNPANYDSYGKFREAWVDYWVEKRPTGMSESEAHARTSSKFDELPVIKDFNTQRRDAELRFWEAHPALLQEAIGTGIESPSKAKDEILR